MKRSIPKLSQLSREEAEVLLEGTGTPFIVTDALEGQSAFERWGFEFFASRYGDDVVELADHIDHPTIQTKTTLRAYMRYASNSAMGPLAELAGDRTLYAYGYQPFTLHPELLSDITDPSCIDNLLGALDEPLRTLLTLVEGSPAGRWIFMGPEATVSSLHTDYTAAWLAQIRGRKLVHMYSPADDERVYGGAIDPLEPDYVQYPASRDATAWVGILEPGETLVMPSYWWHHVVALEPSITASFNFVTKQNFGAYVADLLRDVPLVRSTLEHNPSLAQVLGMRWCADQLRSVG